MPVDERDAKVRCGRCGRLTGTWLAIGDCAVCLCCLADAELDENNWCSLCYEHRSECACCEDL